MIPILAIVLVYSAPPHYITADKAIAYLIVLGLMVLAARRPDVSLIILIAGLPFQGLVLAKLWAWGVPVQIVRHLGAWKEVLALGVVVAGARSYLGSDRRLDAVDRLALGFVAIAAVYVALQTTISPESPSAMSVRLLGFRDVAGFVLLLVGARHAPLPADFTARAGRALLITSTVVAGVGIFEAISSSSWNDFVVRTVKYTRYQVAVLNVTPFNVDDIRVYGQVGGHIVRVGSVFLNELTCGFYLIIGFAVGLERVMRRASSYALLMTVAIGACLLLTQTRSAIIGALLVMLLAFQPAAGRRRHWRVQAAILLASLAILAVPAAVGTGLVDRVKQGTNRSEVDTAGHITGFWAGVSTISHYPLGLGLGTAAGTGQRFFRTKVRFVDIPENNYLEVGSELGIGPMVLFVTLTLALIARLRRAARDYADPLLTAAWTACCGIAVAAWFLQAWQDFAVAWTFWGLAGAALGVAGRAGGASPADRVHDEGVDVTDGGSGTIPARSARPAGALVAGGPGAR